MSLIQMRPFRFDSNCPRNLIEEPTDDSFSDNITNSDLIWETIDSQVLKRNSSHLNQILYAIYKTRFLKPISQITINYENILKAVKKSIFGKILITDHISHALLTNIIGSDILKKEPIGISCEYHINDDLPQELIANYHIIYLICFSELSDKQFRQIVTNISLKESGSYTLFSTYITSEMDFDRIFELSSLASVSKCSQVIQLGAFDCIDENILTIDNNVDMNWFAEYKNYSRKNQINSHINCRIGKRLINVFEHLGEFPAVFRYMKNFNESNKLIAQTVLEGMQKMAAKRLETEENRHNSNYELLIIDRTVDLLTPIRHCIDFRSFIYNELEKNYENDMDLDYNNLKYMSLNEISMITKTLTKIKEKQKDGQNMNLIEKININIKNASEMIEKLQIKGYSELLDIEKRLFETQNQSLNTLQKQNEYLKQFIDKADREVTNTDIIRLLIIYRMFKDLKTEHIKEILKQKKKERQIDWTQIEDFVTLAKDVVNRNTFSQNSSNFKKIVEDFRENKLSEELFPILYRKKKLKSQNRKLFIFVLGGISYNDLVSLQEKYKNEVIFCSNGLITPRMLLNAVLFDDSNK